MDQLEIIKNRRSIRKFSDQDIPDEVLNQILESARWAPSWANTQCWEIIIIKDHGTKVKLQEITTDNNPAALAIIKAPIVMTLCGELGKSGYYKGKAYTKFNDWFMYDLGIATQNISLTVHSLGLGSVIVGAFNHNQARAILNVPSNYEIVSIIPIGYPAQKPAPPKRKETKEFTHYDRFGTKK